MRMRTLCATVAGMRAKGSTAIRPHGLSARRSFNPILKAAYDASTLTRVIIGTHRLTHPSQPFSSPNAQNSSW